MSSTLIVNDVQVAKSSRDIGKLADLVVTTRQRIVALKSRASGSPMPNEGAIDALFDLAFVALQQARDQLNAAADQATAFLKLVNEIEAHFLGMDKERAAKLALKVADELAKNRTVRGVKNKKGKLVYLKLKPEDIRKRDLATLMKLMGGSGEKLLHSLFAELGDYSSAVRSSYKSYKALREKFFTKWKKKHGSKLKSFDEVLAAEREKRAKMKMRWEEDLRKKKPLVDPKYRNLHPKKWGKLIPLAGAGLDALSLKGDIKDFKGEHYSGGWKNWKNYVETGGDAAAVVGDTTGVLSVGAAATGIGVPAVPFLEAASLAGGVVSIGVDGGLWVADHPKVITKYASSAGHGVSSAYHWANPFD